MDYFIKYGNEGFILFLFPLIGLLFEKKLSNRNALWVIGISCLLLVPVFTPYHYVIPYVYRTLILVIVSAVFAICLKQLKRRKAKVWFSIIASAMLFITLGFFSFLDSFSGFQRVERSWRTGGYKIEYVMAQGFAGGPLMTYELSEYTSIPLFIRNIDTFIDRDTAENCVLYFNRCKLFFNKCDGTILKTNNK